MKCLVNKLGVEIDDSGLEIFDTLKIHVYYNSTSSLQNRKISVKSVSPIKITAENTTSGVGCIYTEASAVSDLTVDNHVYEITTSNTDIYLSAGEYDMYIIGFSNVSEFVAEHVGTSNIVEGITITPSDVMTKCIIGKYDGNSSIFKDSTSMTNLILGNNVSGNHLEINIEDFGKLVNLTNLGVYATPKTKITGALEELVKKQVQNGRTSGTIGFDSSNQQSCTFKGKGFTTGWQGKFSWTTSNNVITLTLYHSSSDYESTTINL